MLLLGSILGPEVKGPVVLTQTFVAYLSTTQKDHKPANYYFKRSH